LDQVVNITRDVNTVSAHTAQNEAKAYLFLGISPPINFSSF
jgi:hypothetical protein